MEQFWKLLSDGMLNVFSQDYQQRTALFRLEYFEASAAEFLSVLQLFEAVGGHLDHVGTTRVILC